MCRNKFTFKYTITPSFHKPRKFWLCQEDADNFVYIYQADNISDVVILLLCMLVSSYECKQKMTTVERVVESLLLLPLLLKDVSRQQHDLVNIVVLWSLSSYFVACSLRNFSFQGRSFWRDVLDNFPLKFQREIRCYMKKCLINSCCFLNYH